MKTRNYTRYTPELREKAFQLYCDGKSMGEIKTILDIGDSQGVSRIKREDSWDVRKKVLQMQQDLATATRSIATVGSGELGSSLEETSENGSSTYDTLIARRAEVAGVARIIADNLQEVLKSEKYSPRSLREAWDIYKEATALERSLMQVSVEEIFIMKVYEAVRAEVTDQNLLRRVGERLKLLVAEGRTV